MQLVVQFITFWYSYGYEQHPQCFSFSYTFSMSSDLIWKGLIQIRKKINTSGPLQKKLKKTQTMAEKRPNYETNLLPLLFPYECIKRLDFSQVKYLKTIGPIFDKTTDLKVNFTK
jgi:hypothetical protein